AYTLAVSIEKDEESRAPFDQTLMTQATPPARLPAASLPGTPETRRAAPRADDSAVLDALLEGLGIAPADVAHLSAPEVARLA
ncbi:hypothetical protein AB4Y33_43135, partial [Paraburkholderia sp. BR14319]|uniref:hypothetical protein n=1 Tax=Paraburkholderia sp. BR14319 TaxID=3237005 RepID=UPI0034D32540